MKNEMQAKKITLYGFTIKALQGRKNGLCCLEFADSYQFAEDGGTRSICRHSSFHNFFKWHKWQGSKDLPIEFRLKIKSPFVHQWK